MKFIRFLPWWIVVMAPCVLLAWHYRVSVLTTGINLFILNSDIKKLEYELESIDFSSVALPRLGFEVDMGDQIYDIEAQQLDLQYSLEELYAGQFDTVHIERMRIDIRPTSDTSGSSGYSSLEISPAIGLLVSIIRQPVPANRIVIEELEISHEGSSLPRNQSVKLVADAGEGLTSIQLVQENAAMNIKVKDKTVFMTLKDVSNESVFSAYVALDEGAAESPSKFSGEFEFDSERLLPWLKTVQETKLPDVRGEIFVRLTGENHPELDQWKLQLSGSISEFGAGDMEIQQGEFDLNLVAPEVLTPENISIQLSPENSINLVQIKVDEVETGNVVFKPSGVVGFRDNNYYISLDKDTSVAFDFLEHPELSLANARVVTDVNLSFTDAQTVIDLNPGTSLSADRLVVRDARFDGFEAELLSPGSLEFTGDRETPAWIVKGGNWLAPDVNLSLDELTVNFSAIELDFHVLSEQVLSMDFSSTDTSIHVEQVNAVLETLSGNVNLDGSDLKVRGEFGLPELPPEFVYVAEVDLDQESGGYSVVQSDNIDILSYSKPINGLLSQWIPDLYLESGSLSVEAEGRWKPSTEIQSRFHLELVNANGAYSEVLFTGLNLVGPVSIPPDNQSGSARINIQRLEYGVEVSNIESEFRLSGSDTDVLRGVNVSQLSGEILGSKFESSNFEYDLTATKNHIDISLTGLDIDKVVAMQQFEGLSATGRLDGKLPVEILSSGVSIKLGEFWNQEGGGTIKYRIDPAQAASLSNPLTDTVIKALEEFHYDLLTASVNFEPDGDLSVKFHIEGKSPMLDNNRPVHLNINSEQNVLSLLESLKYADDLNSNIDENVRKKILSTE